MVWLNFSLQPLHGERQSVREIVCIDLVLDVDPLSPQKTSKISTSQRNPGIPEYPPVYFHLHQLIRTETEHDRGRKVLPVFSYLINDHAAETGTVLNRSAELICTLVCRSGQESTDCDRSVLHGSLLRQSRCLCTPAASPYFLRCGRILLERGRGFRRFLWMERRMRKLAHVNSEEIAEAPAWLI